MAENFSKLTTESINPATANIDKCSTFEMIRLINEEDKKVASAVENTERGTVVITGSLYFVSIVRQQFVN